MEFLGYTYDKPTRGSEGKWNIVELEFPDDKLFNEATGKIVRGFREERPRFIIADEDTTRYFIDIFDVRYDAANNTIKIWPHSCREAVKDNYKSKK